MSQCYHYTLTVKSRRLGIKVTKTLDASSVPGIAQALRYGDDPRKVGMGCLGTVTLVAVLEHEARDLQFSSQ